MEQKFLPFCNQSHGQAGRISPWTAPKWASAFSGPLASILSLMGTQVMLSLLCEGNVAFARGGPVSTQGFLT